MVDVDDPSAGTLGGDALIIELAPDTVGAWKVTEAVFVMVTEPLVAVKVTGSETESITVKEATPELLVVALDGVMVEWPEPWDKLTGAPAMGTLAD